MINRFVHYYREHLLTMSKNLFFWILGRIIFINSIYFHICLLIWLLWYKNNCHVLYLFCVNTCFLFLLPFSLSFLFLKTIWRCSLILKLKINFLLFPSVNIVQSSVNTFKQHLCNSFLDAVTQWLQSDVFVLEWKILERRQWN